MPFYLERFIRHLKAINNDDKINDEIIKDCENKMILPKSPVRKAKFIKELMDNLNKKLKEEKRTRIMQNCGRECMGRSVIQKAKKLKKESKDIDEFLELLNKSGIGGGSLKREGNIIHGSYDRCYCSAISKSKEPISLTFCHCSSGWYKELFENALEKPVRVEILESIMNGSDKCRFRIYI